MDKKGQILDISLSGGWNFIRIFVYFSKCNFSNAEIFGQKLVNKIVRRVVASSLFWSKRTARNGAYKFPKGGGKRVSRDLSEHSST
jgi:hypothetical protein